MLDLYLGCTLSKAALITRMINLPEDSGQSRVTCSITTFSKAT